MVEASASVKSAVVGKVGKEESGAAAKEGAAAAAGGVKFSTSLEVIIPSIPEPDLIRDKSTPRSEATRLAAGLAKTLSPDLGADFTGVEATGGEAGAGAAAGGGAAAAGGGGAAAAGGAAALDAPSSTKSLNLATSS